MCILVASCTIQDLPGGYHLPIGNCSQNGQCALGATLMYMCDTRDTPDLLGSGIVTCIANNTWYPTLGTCIAGE